MLAKIISLDKELGNSVNYILLRVFHNSLLSKGFREIPNDAVSSVGETSWSRCNNTINLIKVLRTLLGCGTFVYRHSGPTDLKEVFDRSQHGEGQALALQ